MVLWCKMFVKYKNQSRSIESLVVPVPPSMMRLRLRSKVLSRQKKTSPGRGNHRFSALQQCIRNANAMNQQRGMK
jgi:hypothetical protein